MARKTASASTVARTIGYGIVDASIFAAAKAITGGKFLIKKYKARKRR